MKYQTNSHVSLVSSGWRYAAETVPTIFAITNLQRNAWVAEINSGVGEFTHHLIGRFKHILAFESDAEQRAAAYRRLGHFLSFCSIHGSPDSINLFENSIDVVVSAQPAAIDKPKAVIQGYHRILRSPAWYVIVHNYLADESLCNFLQRDLSSRILSIPLPFTPLDDKLLRIYYSDCDYVRVAYPLQLLMSWTQFLNHSRIEFKKAGYILCEESFKANSLEIIKTIERHGRLCLQMQTEIYVGKLQNKALKNT